jgi:hypothetical protein
MGTAEAMQAALAAVTYTGPGGVAFDVINARLADSDLLTADAQADLAVTVRAAAPELVRPSVFFATVGEAKPAKPLPGLMVADSDTNQLKLVLPLTGM